MIRHVIPPKKQNAVLSPFYRDKVLIKDERHHSICLLQPAICILAVHELTLFNYLFAAHHGGKPARIESDKKRSTPEAVEAIHAGLRWLGLQGVEEAILQSSRQEQHQKAAFAMLERGTPYKCYLGIEELEAIRIKARKTACRYARPGVTKQGMTEQMPRKMPLSPFG